jgi:hypothetical protein
LVEWVATSAKVARGGSKKSVSVVREEAVVAGGGHGATATPLKPEVKEFFDEPTLTISYVVKDPTSAACAIIDSILHFDPNSGRISVKRADEIIAFVEANRLSVEWILETHVHAITFRPRPTPRPSWTAGSASAPASSSFRRPSPSFFNAEPDFATDGRQFDHLFDKEIFAVGNLPGEALHTPGHTPACMTYLIGDCPHPLPVDLAHPVATARDAAVHVPQLQGARTRRLRLGDHRRR